ncbi:hypothetical protein PUN4_440030 [Paraburkholderia unamae]|nr:hypothetical protein PUN4_440030 [Paraburkholderia unamae]
MGARTSGRAALAFVMHAASPAPRRAAMRHNAPQIGGYAPSRVYAPHIGAITPRVRDWRIPEGAWLP